MEFPALYLESLLDFKLKEVIEKPAKRIYTGSGLSPDNDSWFHYFGRKFYTVIRTLYATIIFYFIPFSVLLVHWLTPDKFSKEAEHGESKE